MQANIWWVADGRLLVAARVAESPRVPTAPNVTVGVRHISHAATVAWSAMALLAHWPPPAAG